MSLVILQSMWAMENILPNSETLPMPDAIAQIKARGFHGVTDHMMQRQQVLPLIRELKAHGLTMEGQCFPTSVDALQPTLELAAEFQPHHVTIQPNVRTHDLKQAIDLLEGWQRLAEQIDVPVYIETHRYRLTNDLLFTLEILKELPNLKLLGDLSHYVVIHIPVQETEHGVHVNSAAVLAMIEHIFCEASMLGQAKDIG